MIFRTGKLQLWQTCRTSAPNNPALFSVKSKCLWKKSHTSKVYTRIWHQKPQTLRPFYKLKFDTKRVPLEKGSPSKKGPPRKRVPLEKGSPSKKGPPSSPSKNLSKSMLCQWGTQVWKSSFIKKKFISMGICRYEKVVL